MSLALYLHRLFISFYIHKNFTVCEMVDKWTFLLHSYYSSLKTDIAIHMATVKHQQINLFLSPAKTHQTPEVSDVVSLTVCFCSNPEVPKHSHSRLHSQSSSVIRYCNLQLDTTVTNVVCPYVLFTIKGKILAFKYTLCYRGIVMIINISMCSSSAPSGSQTCNHHVQPPLSPSRGSCCISVLRFCHVSL